MSAAAFDAGRVRIRLGVAAGRVATVEVRSERPQAALLLRGKPADEAVRLVPLLFSLCGSAQGHAARLALAAARGTSVPPNLDATVVAEVLREHLWRLLLDLLPMLGLPPQRDLFVACQRACAAGDRAALCKLLDDACWDDLRKALAELEQPVEIPAAMLPALSAEESTGIWPRLTQDFALRPVWNGLPAETGALARCAQGETQSIPAFAARWLARLDELRTWAKTAEIIGAGGTASSATIGPGIGRAVVATARGLLMHEITLDGDRLADYVIVAPTEWNFHPQGRLAEWLRKAPAGDERKLRDWVGHAIAALDPCVRWELDIVTNLR